MNGKFGRLFALFLFTVAFIVETWINRGVKPTALEWVMLGFAASAIGRVSAYLAILEWVRHFLSYEKPHSSGAGADNEPKWGTGWKSAIAMLVLCPICAGTWGGNVLLTILKFWPDWGHTLLTIFSAAVALSWLLSWATEWLEWTKYFARECVGFMQKVNDPALWVAIHKFAGVTVEEETPETRIAALIAERQFEEELAMAMPAFQEVGD